MAETPFDHQARLETMPESPGVYLMKDKTGKIVYIGKSINLKARVRSYFSGSDTRPFVKRLGKILGDIELILTTNEKEALILENNLIKAHKPRYNVLLKDDKNYLSLSINTKAKWPWVFLTRKPRKSPGVRNFGPYHSAKDARRTLQLLERHFMLRTCPDSTLKNRSRPCLQYQIKRCPAPCVFDIDHDKYTQNVQETTLFLEGRTDELKQTLTERMMQASEDMDFEVAARYRDQLQAVKKVVDTRQAVDSDQNIDQDAIGMYREGDRLCLLVLFIRKGRLESTRQFLFKNQELPDEEILSSFLNQYYHGGAMVPHEVLLPFPLDDAQALGEVFSEIRGNKTKVRHPKRGKGVQLVQTAGLNAKNAFIETQDKEEQTRDLLAKLQTRLKLDNVPNRMECFDISNFQGDKVVGSMVVFRDGVADKAEYRQFKIKTVVGQDDFASMYEVLERRFKRSIEDDWPSPDLIIIDGGKGQLKQAITLLNDLGIHNVDVISLAKARISSDVQSSSLERSLERVFLPGRKNPVILRQNSAELYLLQRLRDEAHRFAISFHRKQRRKATLKSSLDDIPGIGPKRRRALLEHFGSIDKIRDAQVYELTKVDGISQSSARQIFGFFNSEEAL